MAAEQARPTQSGRRPHVRRVLVAAFAAAAALAAGVIFVARALAGPPVLHAGPFPFALAMTPNGSTLYVADGAPYGQSSCSGGSDTVVPVSTVTRTAGKAIRIGGRPAQMVMAPDGRTLYILTCTGNVIPVNVATRTPGAPIPVHAGPVGPGGLAITPNGRTLFVAGHSLIPISTATGRLGTPIPVTGAPGAMVVSPDGRTLYVAGFSDTGTADVITPVDLASGKRGITIHLSSSVYALALAPDGRTLFVSDDNGVVPVDTATGRLGSPIDTGYHTPDALAVSSDGRTMYAAMPDDGTVLPISLTTDKLGNAIHVAPRFFTAYPTALIVAPGDRTLYVIDGNHGNGAVAIISLTVAR